MLEKISEHVYRKYMNPETDRPHLYLIQGTTRSIAIDAGNSKAHVEEFYQEIKEMGLMLPSLTLLTHAHWDHSYGLHAIDHVSIASEKTTQKLEIMSHWLWTKEAMNQRLATGEEIEFCDTCIKKEYED
ncbi:MAG: MBL fold metallo-hydrolase, partial [Erysipelotrichaceae bacterium]|nr:MBL fold metallo-hydrolase [Erysipelotrichaceae bacterium]